MSKKYCAGLGVGIFAVCLGAVALSARAGAQELTNIVEVKTGLFSVSQGKALRVVVSNVGPLQAEVNVKIDFRNAFGRIVATTEGPLRGPVVLDHRLARDSGVVLMSASVRMEAAVGTISAPMTVLEEIDVDTLTVEQRGVCMEGPPSGRVGAQTNCGCPGFQVTFKVPE